MQAPSAGAGQKSSGCCWQGRVCALSLRQSASLTPLPCLPACPARQVFDDYLRKRAKSLGANVLNGLYMRLEQQGSDGPITIHYNSYEDGASIGCSRQQLLPPAAAARAGGGMHGDACAGVEP